MSPRATPYRARNGKVTWQVRFRVDGRPNPVKETFETQREAEKFATLVERVGGTAARATRRTGEDSARTMPTLATWLETHLSQLSASATPGTVAEYRRMAARTWLPRLGALPLDAITRAAVVEWVGWQRQQVARGGKSYSPKSIANAHGLLSACLQAAVEAEVIVRNVAKSVPLPSDAQREEMTFLTREEFAAVLAALPERWRPLVVTLAGTGMRWGEATALTVSDVDPETDLIRVVRAWKKGAEGVYLGAPKTSRSRRTVKMGAQVRAVVLPLLDGRAAGDLVFTSALGARIQAQHFRERVWWPAVQRSGITKRPRVHDLRHTHASWLLAAGVAAQVVQHRLGHESLQTTSRVYGHLLPDAQVAAATATDAALGRLAIES